MAKLYWLEPRSPPVFPDPSLALDEPNGLLAVGGDLSPARLHAAYRLGIFPWYSEGQPVLWWSPDPRMVLFPERLRVARSLHKVLKSARFQVTLDCAFAEVIRACAAPREGRTGTWLTAAMIAAYERLFAQGIAHSVEVWSEGALVGGLYGVAMGRVFFGESMFHRANDASKVALVYLASQLRSWGYAVIDCQQSTPHMERLGAQEVARQVLRALLDRWCDVPGRPGPWTLSWRYPGAA
jgi:leucyl/phenylalanyl-tRNA--protein transferase